MNMGQVVFTETSQTKYQLKEGNVPQERKRNWNVSVSILKIFWPWNLTHERYSVN